MKVDRAEQGMEDSRRRALFLGLGFFKPNRQMKLDLGKQVMEQLLDGELCAWTGRFQSKGNYIGLGKAMNGIEPPKEEHAKAGPKQPRRPNEAAAQIKPLYTKAFKSI